VAVLISAQARAALAPPVLWPPGGLFSNVISITSTAAVGVVRYTLNGTEPTTNSPVLTGVLQLSHSALLTVRAFTSNDASAAARGAYTVLDTNVVGFSTPLPIVVLNTFGDSIPAARSNAAYWMHVLPGAAASRATLLATSEYSGPVHLKPRGYTSRRYPKRSLTVETVDEEGEDRAVPLLGLPADSDWVLYAPYVDKTLMRDVLAYELSNRLGHYAPRTRFVEVFLNESTNALSRAHYAGVYVLVEKVKIAPHRVAIHKLSPKDKTEPKISGGYLFKKDHLEVFSVDAAANSARVPVLPVGLPTGAGAFPAAPAGFLAAAASPAFANAAQIVTNRGPVTNVVNGTNQVLAPPTVTVVRTNTLLITNSISVTNHVVVTNVAVTTNWPVVTNVAISTLQVLATNPVVATETVTGTNAVSTTNRIDAQTVVITTTTSIMASVTCRTNFVTVTNQLLVTNVVVATNMVVLTNTSVATNAVVVPTPVVSTNFILVTNLYRLGPGEASPLAEKLAASGEGFVTSNANAFFFVEPKPEKITAAQRSWLTNYLNRFEAVLYGPEFQGPNGYAAYIDVDSFIDHHLFVEATKNIDGFRFSTFFSKDRGGKLKMEPIWDWNLSLGNARGKQGYMWDRWYWPQLTDQQYSWYRRLFEDPEFAQRYVERWGQWRRGVLATSNVLARIDQIAASLEEPAARNFERWPVLGTVVDFDYFQGKTYAEEIAYLKTWISNRLSWMDAQLVPTPRVTSSQPTPPWLRLEVLSAGSTMMASPARRSAGADSVGSFKK
jgi:hypothetical protein